MQFNTAIFYDIENLIGGYNASSAAILSQLSLIQIDEQIKQKEIGKVSVQRAYADWSITRLGQLKSDMVELGIVPVQLFGFGKGITRNTADIHLAIDAMEVALTKPDITTFVIVSGDGGFSYLASKLHEYGKKVIGVGYVRHVNKALEAVTDEYIWLAEPKALEDLAASNGYNSKTNGESATTNGNSSKKNVEPVASRFSNEFSQSHIISFAKKYKPMRDVSLNSAKSVSQEIIDFLISDPDLYDKLNNVGVNVSVFMEIIRYRLIGFQLKDIGYEKSIDFIKAVVKKSELKIVLKGECDFRLAMKNHNPIGYKDVENDNTDEHTVENYRQILLTNTPCFRQFNKEIISTVCDYMCRHKTRFQNVSMNEVTVILCKKIDYDALEIVKAVTTLISGGCFTFEENNKLIKNMSFKPANTRQAFEFLDNAMQAKVNDTLKEVNEEILEGVLN